MTARTITLDGGKYAVTNNNGILTAKRHGEAWPAADHALLGDKLSLAMVHRIEELEDLVREVRAEIPVDSRDRGADDRLAAWVKKTEGLVP